MSPRSNMLFMVKKLGFYNKHRQPFPSYFFPFIWPSDRQKPQKAPHSKVTRKFVSIKAWRKTKARLGGTQNSIVIYWAGG